MKRQHRAPTIAELFTALRGAEIVLRQRLEYFEANKSRYQPDFIPTYVSNAQNAYDAAKKAYDAAVDESEKPR
jgi:hypothetical protein